MEVHGRSFGAVIEVRPPGTAGRDGVPVDDRPGAFGPMQYRRILLARGRRCSWCGWTPAGGAAGAAPAGPATRLEVDHIVPIHFGGGNTEANAAVLCDACHAAKSGCEIALTHGLPEHFADGTHPAGGADGWYVRSGDAPEGHWEIGPAPTPVAVMLRYRAWASARLHRLAAAGWADPLARAWRGARAQAAAGGAGPLVYDPEPTPFHVRWGCLAAISALSDGAPDAAGEDRRIRRHVARLGADSGRALAVRAWWRPAPAAALATSWRLLAPAAWLCAAPPDTNAAPAPRPRRRVASPVYPPVPKPTLRPRSFA